MGETMFEAKFENIIGKISETSEEEKYARALRNQQICEVIGSLTEEEFISLKENVGQTFEKIETLLKVVREKIQLKSHYEEILEAVNQAYRMSPEHSNYYRNQYLDLLDFLHKIQPDLDALEKEENQEKIEEQLKKDIEEPLYQKKEAVLKSMVTRKKLKSRIGNNTSDFEPMEVTSDFEPMEVTLYHLYQEIWQALGFGLLEGVFYPYQELWENLGFDREEIEIIEKKLDLSVCDEMKKLILAIINLKNKEIKVLRQEEIAKCLEDMDDQTAELVQNYETFSKKIDLLKTPQTVKKQDKVLKELINLIEKVPLNQADYNGGGNPRKELQTIRCRNWLVRRATYSNCKIIPHGEDKITFNRLLQCIEMQVGYSDYADQIKMKAMNQMNSIFLLELWNSIDTEEIPETDLYCKNFGKIAMVEASPEAIYKRIVQEEEIGALRGFVYHFYLSCVKSERERKKFHARLKDGKLDKTILGIVDKIEAVKKNTSQDLQEALEKVDPRYIIISSELEMVRAVQEEDIINAVIDQTPVIYQKTIGNE